MAITIKLSFHVIDNLFVEFPWDVDFATGGVPDMVFTYELTDDPVAVYGHYNYATRFWEVQFDPAVAWASIEGKNVASLIGDGTTVLGSNDNDRLLMTDASEKVFGDFGDDVLVGRGGNDHLIGGYRDDELVGGAGRDILQGDSGGDYFVFITEPAKGNVDHVVDFHPWKHLSPYGSEPDHIWLWRPSFDALRKTGLLKKKFFENGKVADDKNDYLLYDRKSAALFYDEDGSGKKHDPVKVAVFDNQPKLKPHDISLYEFDT